MRLDSSGAHLNNAEVWLLASFIYRNLGYPFYPVLNGVCNVGNNLANDCFIIINPGWTDLPALFAPDNPPAAIQNIILCERACKLSIQRTSLSITW
jgi:hypothetical protein